MKRKIFIYSILIILLLIFVSICVYYTPISKKNSSNNEITSDNVSNQLSESETISDTQLSTNSNVLSEDDMTTLVSSSTTEASEASESSGDISNTEAISVSENITGIHNDATSHKNTSSNNNQSTTTTKTTSANSTTTWSKKPTSGSTNALVSKKYTQNLDYSETTNSISNPDQGFYRPLYVTMATTGTTYNKNVLNNSAQLYHVRISINAFSKAAGATSDMEITKAALDGLDELLSYIKSKNKSAIIRFAYDKDFKGKKDQEPPTDMMVKHIQQVAPILNKYQDTITAVEAGLIGPYGEMHSSVIAKDDTVNNAIIDAYLNYTENFPILVRTPSRIYTYLGITINDIGNKTIQPTSKAYRLGLFNDGYLGSSSDLGTYKDRTAEVAWIARQNGHLPYGGEVSIPDSTLHNIEVCLPEMYQIHLSYLNIEWNENVINKWKATTYTKSCAHGTESLYYNSTAFDYINNHMGYRYVLTNSILEYSNKMDNFTAYLTLKNIGFGNLTKNKKATIILVNKTDASKNITIPTSVIWNGKESLDVSFKLNTTPTNGQYDVYIRLDNGNGQYAIQWANNLWNSSISANKIGSFQFN